MNNVTACERMIFRQGDDDPFAPHRKRLGIPFGVVISHKGNIDGGVRDLGDQVFARSIDKMNFDVRERAAVLNQRGPEIASRKRRMNADG